MKENTKRNTGNNPIVASPKKRNIRTFEADDDVNKMIENAIARGVKQVFFMNHALRAWLTANGYAKKQAAPSL